MVKRVSLIAQNNGGDGSHNGNVGDTVDVATWQDYIKRQYQADQAQAIIDAYELLAQEVLKVDAANLDDSLLATSLDQAVVLTELHVGHEAIVAGLWFAFYQQHSKRFDAIHAQLGSRVLPILQGAAKMTHYAKVSHGSKQHSAMNVDRLRKMMLAMVNDIEVVLVKLVERTWVIRHADTLDKEQQDALAREVMEIYAPLANRLGIWQLKWELEDRAFRILESETYQHISQSLSRKRLEREQDIAEVIAKLLQSLKQEGIEAQVSGRAKHIYSIC